jgi:hypothetical protein
MIFPANQRIRFIGPSGPSRAAAFARELDGRCSVWGNEIFLKQNIEIGPRLFDPQAIPFKTEDAPTSGVGDSR